MPRNTSERIPVYVVMDIPTRPTPIADVKYIFLSGLRDTLFDNFGQVLVPNNLAVAKVVYAPNNIKPARASKFVSVAQGYEGSFISKGKGVDLKDDGYSTTRAKMSSPALSGVAKSVLYYAEINGLKIGYRCNVASLPDDFTAQTGLTLATASDFVIMGAKFPKLGQAIYVNPTTGKASKFACDPAKYDDLSGNWRQGKPPLSSQADLNAILFGA